MISESVIRRAVSNSINEFMFEERMMLNEGFLKNLYRDIKRYKPFTSVSGMKYMQREYRTKFGNFLYKQGPEKLISALALIGIPAFLASLLISIVLDDNEREEQLQKQRSEWIQQMENDTTPPINYHWKIKEPLIKTDKMGYTL